MDRERGPDGSADAGRRLRPWLVALAIVLVFPAISFAVAVGVELKYNGDIVSAVEAEIGRPLTAAERSKATIAVACDDPELAGEDVCTDVRLASATRTLALGAAVVGLAVLGVIAIASATASRRREALLRVFRPALYLTLAGLAVLTIADGLLTLSAVYLGIGVFLGRILPVLLLLIALGVLLGTLAILRAILSTRRRATTFVVGRLVSREAEPQVYGLVDDIARQLRTESPDHVLVGLDPSFFVTEANVVATDGLHQGRTLFLSLPVARIFTLSELRAVLGHELGHFRGEDTVWSERFYPVYRGVIEAISGLVAAGAGSGERSVALIPAALLLTLFLDAFAVPERAISRERELAADQAGAEAASAADVASALLKLEAFGPEWGPTVESLATASSPPANASDTFVERVRLAATDPASVLGLDATRLTHPTDSHPPVGDRLRALAISDTEIAAAARAVEPANPAEAIVQSRDRYEQELTAWIETRLQRRPVPELAQAEAG
jgi:Zn-dependent protease with chaperone function